MPLSLSFSTTLTGPNQLFLNPKIPHLSLPKTTTFIRMGGGPRTFPGGVSKWEWKRMQAKKAKQLLKARLCRERQIYEMRKRAELKAAVSELERPWEVVEKAPNLFSVSADEQVKVLADRFQKPGGFDLWTDKDGPQLFATVDDLPSARFFPKGVVHSVKPYQRITETEKFESLNSDAEDKNGYKSNGRSSSGRKLRSGGSISEGEEGLNGQSSYTRNSATGSSGKNGRNFNGDTRNKGNRRRNSEAREPIRTNKWDSRRGRFDRKQGGFSRGNAVSPSSRGFRASSGDVYDMSLEQDGSYRLRSKDLHSKHS